MAENNQKMGLYEVYGDIEERKIYDSGKYSSKLGENEVIVENISNEKKEDENILQSEEESIESNDVVVDGTSTSEIIEEQMPELKWEEYMHPEFPWNNRKLWINNPKAVNYWLNTKKGSARDLAKIRNEEENIKTY